MKRLQFLKNLFTLTATATLAPSLLASTELKSEYTFNELFTIWPKNERLIYPNKDSSFYKNIEDILGDRITDSYPTYLPVHQLMIPIKEKYSFDELKPIIFYFENVYSRNQKFGSSHGVVFRMIKDYSDRMHLDVFLNYKY